MHIGTEKFCQSLIKIGPSRPNPVSDIRSTVLADHHTPDRTRDEVPFGIVPNLARVKLKIESVLCDINSVKRIITRLIVTLIRNLRTPINSVKGEIDINVSWTNSHCSNSGKRCRSWPVHCLHLWRGSCHSCPRCFNPFITCLAVYRVHKTVCHSFQEVWENERGETFAKRY